MSIIYEVIIVIEYIDSASFLLETQEIRYNNVTIILLEITALNLTRVVLIWVIRVLHGHIGCAHNVHTRSLSQYSYIWNRNQCSLVPRPHHQEGKGSGELGQNSRACAEEFPHANQIAEWIVMRQMHTVHSIYTTNTVVGHAWSQMRIW